MSQKTRIIYGITGFFSYRHKHVTSTMCIRTVYIAVLLCRTFFFFTKVKYKLNFGCETRNVKTECLFITTLSYFIK